MMSVLTVSDGVGAAVPVPAEEGYAEEEVA